jgi:hypothetical protein
VNYTGLVKKAYDFFVGDAGEDEFKLYFEQWAKKNEYTLPKRVRLLKDTAWNVEGDVLHILNEDEENIYYNDSMNRWCYLPKNEGWFEVIL